MDIIFIQNNTKKEVLLFMNIKTVAKGVLIGSAIGTVCYVVSGTTPRQRRHMKKTISRGIRNFGTMCNDFSYLM